jgi:hypothetical protein
VLLLQDGPVAVVAGVLRSASGLGRDPNDRQVSVIKRSSSDALLICANPNVSCTTLSETRRPRKTVSGLRTCGTAWVSWLIGESQILAGVLPAGLRGSMMIVEVLVAVEDGVELFDA